MFCVCFVGPVSALVNNAGVIGNRSGSLDNQVTKRRYLCRDCSLNAHCFVVRKLAGHVVEQNVICLLDREWTICSLFSL